MMKRKIKLSAFSLMILIFIVVILVSFLSCTIYSLVQYATALVTPVEEMNCVSFISTCNPFLKFSGLFYYQNPIFFQDRDDVFRDWFSINGMVATNSPYLVCDSSYPPLVLLMAKVFVAMANYDGGYMSCLDTTAGMVSLLVYYAICVIPTVVLIFIACRRAKLNWWMTSLLALVFFLTVPFLFLFDRGNYVLLAIPFTFLFVLYYDHQKWWVREIAYVSLAFSVGIKLYPAAFALLLLRKRDFFGFARTVFYSVLAVLLPFLCFDDGFENIGAFLYWLLDFSGSKGGVVSEVVYGISYSYSPYNLVAYLAGILGEEYIDLGIAETAIVAEKIGKVFTLLCIVMVIFTGLLSNKSWKIMLSATLATLFVPSISFVYSAVMMLFPVLYFLLDRDKKKLDWAYLALFLVVLSPIVTDMVIPYQRLGFRWGVSLKHMLETLSYLALLVLLTVDNVLNVINYVKTRKKQ